jgi:hypothetical protein
VKLNGNRFFKRQNRDDVFSSSVRGYSQEECSTCPRCDLTEYLLLNADIERLRMLSCTVVHALHVLNDCGAYLVV